MANFCCIMYLEIVWNWGENGLEILSTFLQIVLMLCVRSSSTPSNKLEETSDHTKGSRLPSLSIDGHNKWLLPTMICTYVCKIVGKMACIAANFKIGGMIHTMDLKMVFFRHGFIGIDQITTKVHHRVHAEKKFSHYAF